MKNWLLFPGLCWLLFVITQCRESAGDSSQIKVSRDKTITPANAYTDVFLDSLFVEDFIAKEVNADSIATYIRNFYNSRNYSLAWFDENGLTVHAEGFWNAHNRIVRQTNDSSVYDKQLHQIVDTLLIGDTTFSMDKSLLQHTELRFTRHVFQYMQYAYSGKVDPTQVQWNIPRRKIKPVALLDSFLNSKNSNWVGLNEPFRQLQKQLFKYRDIERKGGWDHIDISKRKFKPGDKDSLVLLVKRRLQVSGDYIVGDTSTIYTADLVTAIKQVEASFGLKQDDIIDATLIKQLNVTVKDRIEQMLINLERMKWMPELSPNFLFVNIPEYRLHVVENGKSVLAMNIVVGKAATRTIIFSNELKYVVFSPYWNVPRSIVRNEIYPAMQRSSSYLRRNNMEVKGYSGGLPIVRQKPGSGNALGRVKFMFPNKYNIYLHDTPNRSLFNRQQRAFSHGCIRVNQPFDLAVYLLRNKPEWTTEKIKMAMNSSQEKWVTLDKVVPVFITYFTSWVDEDGLLHFSDDIYGHDERMKEHLFE